jgi:hypothetical protein
MMQTTDDQRSKWYEQETSELAKPQRFPLTGDNLVTQRVIASGPFNGGEIGPELAAARYRDHQWNQDQARADHNQIDRAQVSGRQPGGATPTEARARDNDDLVNGWLNAPDRKAEAAILHEIDRRGLGHVIDAYFEKFGPDDATARAALRDTERQATQQPLYDRNTSRNSIETRSVGAWQKLARTQTDTTHNAESETQTQQQKLTTQRGLGL